MIIKHTLKNKFPQQNIKIGPPKLIIHNLKRSPTIQKISLKVHQNKMLTLTNLIKTKKTKTVQLIFGTNQHNSNKIELNNHTLQINNPQNTIRTNIYLLTKDQKTQKLILKQSILENFGLPNLSQLSTTKFINTHKKHNTFTNYIQQLQIKIPNDQQTTNNLSNNNQQKIVLTK